MAYNRPLKVKVRRLELIEKLQGKLSTMKSDFDKKEKEIIENNNRSKDLLRKEVLVPLENVVKDMKSGKSFPNITWNEYDRVGHLYIEVPISKRVKFPEKERYDADYRKQIFNQEYARLEREIKILRMSGEDTITVSAEDYAYWL